MSLLSNEPYCEVEGCGQRTLVGRIRCAEHEGAKDPKVRPPPTAPEERTSAERQMVAQYSVKGPSEAEIKARRMREMTAFVTMESEARAFEKKMRKLAAKNYKSQQAVAMFHKFQVQGEARRLREQKTIKKRTRRRHWSETHSGKSLIFEVPDYRNPYHGGQMSSPENKARRRTWKDNELETTFLPPRVPRSAHSRPKFKDSAPR